MASTVDSVVGVASAIVGVAMVTTLVGHPNTAQDIKAVGDAFNNALYTAEGSAG